MFNIPFKRVILFTVFIYLFGLNEILDVYKLYFENEIIKFWNRLPEKSESGADLSREFIKNNLLKRKIKKKTKKKIYSYRKKKKKKWKNYCHNYKIYKIFFIFTFIGYIKKKLNI